jgi:putative peptidoglycan lipid II flippase
MAADRFEKNARTFTLLTLVSRATGLLRDATLARAFGIGPVMDAFSFGFMVPNLFRRLFGEGALSASFMPIYARLLREDPKAAARFASFTLVAMAIALNALVIVIELVLLSMHWTTPERHLVTAMPIAVGGSHIMPMAERLPQLGLELLMVMLPYMPLVCMVAIVGSLLQTHDRFGPTAASPVILNLAMVAAAVGFLPVFRGDLTSQSRHALLVGASVVVAGVLQLAWALAAARGHGLSLRGLRLRGDPALAPFAELLRKAMPVMLGLGVLQVNTFIDGLVASWPTMVGPTIFGFPFPLQEGAMSTLANAQRLYEFPLGVFGIAVAAAIFPVLSRQSNDADAFVSTLRRGLRLTIFIGLPASVGLMLIAVPAVATVLQGGRFTPEDTQRVAFVLLGYAPAIWSYSAVHLLTRAFYAKGDTSTPTRIAIGMVALNLTLNVTLIFTPLREAGLAWSTAICSVIQCLILLRVLRGRLGLLVDAAVLRSWSATGLATAVMAVAVLAVAQLFPGAPLTWAAALRETLILIGVGGVALVASAAALRRPELRWALGSR